VLSDGLVPVTAILTTDGSTRSTIGASVGGTARPVSAVAGMVWTPATSRKEQRRRKRMLMMHYSPLDWGQVGQTADTGALMGVIGRDWVCAGSLVAWKSGDDWSGK
jgi:hypothetical protein